MRIAGAKLHGRERLYHALHVALNQEVQNILLGPLLNNKESAAYFDQTWRRVANEYDIKFAKPVEIKSLFEEGSLPWSDYDSDFPIIPQWQDDEDTNEFFLSSVHIPKEAYAGQTAKILGPFKTSEEARIASYRIRHEYVSGTSNWSVLNNFYCMLNDFKTMGRILQNKHNITPNPAAIDSIIEFMSFLRKFFSNQQFVPFYENTVSERNLASYRVIAAKKHQIKNFFSKSGPFSKLARGSLEDEAVTLAIRDAMENFRKEIRPFCEQLVIGIKACTEEYAKYATVKKPQGSATGLLLENKSKAEQPANIYFFCEEARGLLTPMALEAICASKSRTQEGYVPPSFTNITSSTAAKLPKLFDGEDSGDESFTTDTSHISDNDRSTDGESTINESGSENSSPNSSPQRNPLSADKVDLPEITLAGNRAGFYQEQLNEEEKQKQVSRPLKFG